jgi:hypothetical protein
MWMEPTPSHRARSYPVYPIQCNNHTLRSVSCTASYPYLEKKKKKTNYLVIGSIERSSLATLSLCVSRSLVVRVGVAPSMWMGGWMDGNSSVCTVQIVSLSSGAAACIRWVSVYPLVCPLPGRWATKSPLLSQGASCRAAVARRLTSCPSLRSRHRPAEPAKPERRRAQRRRADRAPEAWRAWPDRPSWRARRPCSWPS